MAKKKYWKPQRANTTNGTSNPPNQQDEPPNPPLRKHATDLMYDEPRSASGQPLVRETISAYNLKWPKLREWLRKEFADCEDLDIEEEQTALQDKYYVWLPKPLTKTQKDYIVEELKEKNPDDVARQQDRRSVSPDRERIYDD